MGHVRSSVPVANPNNSTRGLRVRSTPGSRRPPRDTLALLVAGPLFVPRPLVLAASRARARPLLKAKTRDTSELHERDLVRRRRFQIPRPRDPGDRLDLLGRKQPSGLCEAAAAARSPADPAPEYRPGPIARLCQLFGRERDELGAERDEHEGAGRHGLTFGGRPGFFEAASSRSCRTFSGENNLVPFDSRAAATNSPRLSQDRIVSGARLTSLETVPISRGGCAIGAGALLSDSLSRFLVPMSYAAEWNCRAEQ